MTLQMQGCMLLQLSVMPPQPIRTTSLQLLLFVYGECLTPQLQIPHHCCLLTAWLG